MFIKNKISNNAENFKNTPLSSVRGNKAKKTRGGCRGDSSP
jgi:hypothetical protein